MSWDYQINGFVDDVIQYFQRSFLLTWKTYDFGNRLLRWRKSAQPGWVREGINLLDELKSDEIKDKSLLLEDHDHHVLSELDIHNELIGIEGDLCSILFFMIIPNDNFVSLLFIHQNNHICFVHHLYQRNVGVQVLHLLFWSGAARVVLQNLKSSACRDGKVFLGLIGRNSIDLGLHFWNTPILRIQCLSVSLSILVDKFLVYTSVFGLDDISLLCIRC